MCQRAEGKKEKGSSGLVSSSATWHRELLLASVLVLTKCKFLHWCWFLMFWQVLSLTAVILDVKWKICWQFLVTSDAIPQLGAVHPWARHSRCRTLPSSAQVQNILVSPHIPKDNPSESLRHPGEEPQSRTVEWCLHGSSRQTQGAQQKRGGGRRLMTSNPADLNPPVCTVSLSSEGGCSLRWLSLTQICLINLVGGTFWQRTRLCVSWTDEEWYLIERMHH